MPGQEIELDPWDGFPGDIVVCRKCKKAIDNEVASECSCYEIYGGHQPGCARYRR